MTPIRLASTLSDRVGRTSDGCIPRKRAADCASDWNAGTASCTVLYYNTCTGWLWVWSGWAANSVIGTVYDTCCDPATQETFVTGTYLAYWTGAPPGYGFTGTASLDPPPIDLRLWPPPAAAGG